MEARTIAALFVACGALVGMVAGCGTTEKAGEVGDTLTAKGIQATLEQVDTHVPVPAGDITGLSQPAPGTKLVGARVKVCSDHGGAVGPYDFALDASSGDATLKYPQRNYDDSFETVRADCGDGWVVFQVPESADPERITFDFQDTGTAQHPETEVHAKFSWSV